VRLGARVLSFARRDHATHEQHRGDRHHVARADGRVRTQAVPDQHHVVIDAIERLLGHFDVPVEAGRHVVTRQVDRDRAMAALLQSGDGGGPAPRTVACAW
jgi:hypothetical protein